MTLKKEQRKWANEHRFESSSFYADKAKESIFLNVLSKHIEIRKPVKPKVSAVVLDAIEDDMPIDVREILLRHLDIE